MLPAQSGATTQPDADPRTQAQAERVQPDLSPLRPTGRDLDFRVLRAWLSRPCDLVDGETRAAVQLAGAAGTPSTETWTDFAQATCTWNDGKAPRLTVSVSALTTDNDDRVLHAAAYASAPEDVHTSLTLEGVRATMFRPEHRGETSECGILMYGDNASHLHVYLSIPDLARDTCADIRRTAAEVIRKVENR